jgi:hypothetical protein
VQRHLARLGLREQQQRAHDLRQPLHVLQRIENRLAVLLGIVRSEQRYFKLPPDGGYRRAQLMRNIGGELPDLIERVLQAFR